MFWYKNVETRSWENERRTLQNDVDRQSSKYERTCSILMHTPILQEEVYTKLFINTLKIRIRMFHVCSLKKMFWLWIWELFSIINPSNFFFFCKRKNIGEYTRWRCCITFVRFFLLCLLKYFQTAKSVQVMFAIYFFWGRKIRQRVLSMRWRRLSNDEAFRYVLFRGWCIFS